MLAPSSVCIPSVCANPGLAVRVRGSARARTYTIESRKSNFLSTVKEHSPQPVKRKAKAPIFSCRLYFRRSSDGQSSKPFHYSTARRSFSGHSPPERTDPVTYLARCYGATATRRCFFPAAIHARPASRGPTISLVRSDWTCFVLVSNKQT